MQAYAPWYAVSAAAAVLCLVTLAGPPLQRAAVALPAPAPEPHPDVQSIPVRGLIPIDVLRVIDGDTVEVRAHVWLDQSIVTRVRLRGIDAPELGKGCATEARQAINARDKLAALTASGGLHLTALGRDKYGGRVVGDLLTGEGQSVAKAMLASGHARQYAAGKRQSWC